MPSCCFPWDVFVKLKNAASCNGAQKVPAFFLDEFQAGKTWVGITSRDTKQSLPLHHLIRIRIDDKDKIKCFWLCVRCKKKKIPTSQAFIMEIEPVVHGQPVIFNSHASYTRDLLTFARSGPCVRHNACDIHPILA